MQSTFTIFRHDQFLNLPPGPLAPGMKLFLENNLWQKNNEPITAICIVPPDFDHYFNATRSIEGKHFYIDKPEDINKHSIKDYADLDEYDELLPFEEAVQNLIFLDVAFLQTSTEKSVTIQKLYNTTALLQYWIKQNTFTNPQKMQHIGLGQVIYDALPPDHNYFDICWVCTCAQSSCYNYAAWYIRFANSYAVGFIINYDKTIELNALHDCYNEDNYEEFVQDKNKAIEHNKKLAAIETVLAANIKSKTAYTLSDKEKAILEEGTDTYFFPCRFEHDDFCLYQPMLLSNKNNLLL